MARKETRADFQPRFDGPEALESLLKLAGCALPAEEVAARFKASQESGQPRSAAIPGLFSGEPHFPDPALARRLYENLFGLWELVESGGATARPAPVPAPAPRATPEPPGPFVGVPDEAWVESAWRYLDGMDERSQRRLEHGFDNRQDGLRTFLEQVELSDAGYPQAHTLLFELWAMLETGWPPGLFPLTPEAPVRADVAAIPPALMAYVEEALFLAAQEESEPLSADEAKRVRAAVERGLAALWGARRPAAKS